MSNKNTTLHMFDMWLTSIGEKGDQLSKKLGPRQKITISVKKTQISKFRPIILF